MRIIPDMLKDLLARGVEVIAVIRSDLEKEERLKETGANVRVNDSLAIDVVIIDKSLIWYGSVNYLGYNTDENNAICIYDLKLAENILEASNPQLSSSASFLRLNVLSSLN